MTGTLTAPNFPAFYDPIAQAPTYVGDVANKAIRVSFGSTGGGPNLDAFSRLRVTTPASLFDSQLQYDTQPLIWEDITANGGTVTHLPNESSARLRITTTSNSSVIRQTRTYHRYQPGRSQFIALTTVIGAATTNVIKRVGYFDAQNGVFLQQAGDGTISFVVRTFTSGSVVDNAVTQANWNLDKLNGTGTSTLTLDLTKAQIVVLDFQWLGTGRVRVGFDINGQLIYCHEFLNANNLTVVYMTTPNLPIRYEIAATGAAGAQTDLKQICSSVFSEGGFEEERAYPFNASNGITSITVSTRRPILSIRPKATFNSIVNRGLILPDTFEFAVSGNNAYVEIVYNGTLTSASFASVNSSSIVEFDVAATTISGGITVGAMFAPVAAGITRTAFAKDLASRLPITLDSTGANPISLSIVATSFTGNASCNGILSWLELR